MHDTIRVETLHVPAVAVVTTVFRSAAQAQAGVLGRPDLALVYVPHPIQDQTPQSIASKADHAIQEIVSYLTTEVYVND